MYRKKYQIAISTTYCSLNISDGWLIPPPCIGFSFAFIFFSLGNSHEIISQIVVFLNYMDEQDIHDKKNKEE